MPEASNIHGVENVDGTPSHRKTLDGSKVPKDVQKKVKDSKDYKKMTKRFEKDAGSEKRDTSQKIEFVCE